MTLPAVVATWDGFARVWRVRTVDPAGQTSDRDVTVWPLPRRLSDARGSR